VAAIAESEGYDVHALSFDYGQRHREELIAASRLAQTMGVVEHRVVRIDLRAFGGSALTAEIDVPKHRSVDEMGESIPITYVPARNVTTQPPGLISADRLSSVHDFSPA
jgi:7-cyano-7-deazaguanine synthase